MIYLFIAIAAIANAMMDVLENENYSSSVFRKWNQKFWYKRESWKHQKKILGVRLDGWHLVKYIMLGSLVMAMREDLKTSAIVVIVWWICFETSYKLFKSKL